MDTIQEQIRVLQTSVRRQRFAIVTLASILTALALIGAVRPAGDATFDTITCKGWTVVDEDGKGRISASTLFNGTAAVAWLDKDGRFRIFAGTNPDGSAGVKWIDKDVNVRIRATTNADGSAVVKWADKDGKARVGAGTLADGAAGVWWFDKDGKERILAGTEADGTVIYPTKDGK
jgi:hypothetical protein